jgi:hypothetical protein
VFTIRQAEEGDAVIERSSRPDGVDSVAAQSGVARDADRGRYGRLLGLVVGLAITAGCGSASSSPTNSATPPPVTATAAAASERPTCPASDGGACLGPLTAGTYSTELFVPQVTYTVPAGWGNLEDLPGNFMLLPPGSDLEGVNAGTSDYLGIYSNVTLAAPCAEPRPTAKGPAAMAAYIATHPEFTTSNEHPATVGRLSGVVLDIKLAKTWKKACVLPDGGPAANLITGLAPSGLDHSIGGPLVMRLYLLSDGSEVRAVELDDALSGGAHLRTLDAIVKSVRFAG